MLKSYKALIVFTLYSFFVFYPFAHTLWCICGDKTKTYNTQDILSINKPNEHEQVLIKPNAHVHANGHDICIYTEEKHESPQQHLVINTNVILWRWRRWAPNFHPHTEAYLGQQLIIISAALAFWAWTKPWRTDWLIDWLIDCFKTS